MENNFKKEDQQKQISIKGMHCKSCVDLIENKLKTLKGIKEVKVNFIQERAFIRFNPAKISLDIIVGKIKEMGYKPSLEDKMNESPQKEKIIRIRLEKPSFLTVLIGIILILTFINIGYTFSLRNKLSVLAGGTILESGSQSPGVLKEVESNQPSQQKSLPNEPSQQPSKIEVSVDDDPVRGSENAPVTIIEFSEYQCPFCERFFRQTLPQIEENYIKTGKVKYVFRDFPLGFHQNAQKAAEASECADEQGKFWEYHDKLFENQNALEVSSLKQYANDLGLNEVEFNNCLDSGEMASEVEKDFTDGSQYGVSGTPAFFINGIELVGAQPYNAFEQIIEQELNKEK